MSRRDRGWAIGGGILVVLAGIAATLVWANGDRSTPRLWIQAPDASWPQGFTSDGRSFVTLSPEGVVVWDSTTWRARDPWALRAFPISDFSADGRTCVGVHGFDAESAKVAWVDVASGAIKAKFFAGQPRVLDLAFVAGDASIRAFLADRTGSLEEVVTWDLASGAETRRPIGGPGGSMMPNWPAGYSRDGRVLAYLNPAAKGVELWDVATDGPIGPVLRTPSTAVVPFSKAAFTPGDDRLLVARADGAVEVWSLADRRWLRTIPVHPDGYSSVDLQVSPDGRTLASSSFHHAGPSRIKQAWADVHRWLGVATGADRDEEVVLVDLDSGARLARWPGSFHPRFSPDGRTVVTHESWSGKFAVRDVPRTIRPPQ